MVGSSPRLTERIRHTKAARIAYAWTSPFVDPLRIARAPREMVLFLRDYLKYRRHPGAERLAFADMIPALHERLAAHEIDAHYFYVNAWVARRIADTGPPQHVDVASQVVLSAILAASLPVVFVDYRPFTARVAGLRSVAADLLRLPFTDDSLPSLSCLHVAEHVGLGRYGDPIDPAGTRKAAGELARVLAPGGHLLFALPVGRPRVAFNAHRVHAADIIVDYFPSLTLREFSGVDDQGKYLENVRLDALKDNEYACGFFWFTK
jgi:SAM-dependent methyltransferase